MFSFSRKSNWRTELVNFADTLASASVCNRPSQAACQQLLTNDVIIDIVSTVLSLVPTAIPWMVCEAYMILGMRIRAARLRAGLSQGDLAAQIGVSRTAVANWESSKSRTRPSSERLEAISHHTGVSWEWLATGRGSASISDDNILAADVDLVEDPVERRLLQMFRHGNTNFKRALIGLLEATSAGQR